MKKIVVVWVPFDIAAGYEKEMRVFYSNHDRFTKGTRFDFGFMKIACEQGFIIEVLP